ncbi:cytochrome c [Desulfobacterota bacterium AH_259_B03_O07]|nr:cytochrome c [Desulfobacterota bacterium AH_259_B03_O07]
MNLLRKLLIINNLPLSLLSFLIINLLSLSINFELRAQDKNISSEGKELFIKNRCVNCHTLGRGRFVGPDLAGISNKYNKDEIKRWIQNPQLIYKERGKMPINDGYPPMPPLQVSPTDAEAIADYLFTVKTASDKYEDGGDINGRVLNKSTEMAAEGVELILKAYIGDRVTDERKIISDVDGNFGFRDLSWDRSYTISLNYKGAEYVTDKMVFSPDEDSKAIELPIYEPTDKENVLSIRESHMIVEVSDDSISVADLIVFNNKSKKIYIGKDNINNGGRETLRINLPRDAANIRFIHGISQENVIKTNLGFSDTNGVWPGIKRVVYTYTLPYKSGSNVILKKVNYPTENFLLLVSDSGEKVMVDGLIGGNTVQIENENFFRWTGVDLTSGMDLKIVIRKPLAREDLLKWVVLGVLVLILGSGIFYSTVVRKRESKSVDVQTKVGELERERRNLVHEIALLDDRFEAKDLEEAEYKKERLEKKKRLIKMIQQIQNSANQ